MLDVRYIGTEYAKRQRILYDMGPTARSERRATTDFIPGSMANLQPKALSES